MLRGVNQQQIFKETEDYEKFIQILKDCKAISEYKLFAYCLMGNHIHLLMKPGKERLDQIFKRIGGRFVYWYNLKYGRIGHLFQDRYKSEAVESEEYFFTVLRYIHQNPIKAGICKKVKDYRYSSYREYVIQSEIIDTEFVFQLISKEAFIELCNTDCTEHCMDVAAKPNRRVTDEQAQKTHLKATKCANTAEFQALEIKQRDKYLRKLKEQGLSVRQVSRLTGVSYYLAQKA